jgi:formyltetrahydrofolate-dependent phosphoribosylglycinamide formyltransferase
VIPATDDDPLRLAILLSGTGRSLDHLASEIAAGRLPARIVGVLASRDDVRGFARAGELGLPTATLRRRDFTDPERYGEAIGRQLKRWRTELAAMAGFLHLWRIPPAFRGRVMNIHPALLPAFGGKGMHGDHVHAAVVASGVKLSGCTVHFADNEYDAGPIILQRSVPVAFDETAETLAARVFAEERVAYPEAIRLFAQGRLEIVGRRVRVADAPADAAAVRRRRARSS